MDFTNWYQTNSPYLSGHGLWLRGGELNTIPAKAWDSRPFRVLISRLSTYRDTADSFTHTLLYQLISRIDGAFPDLAWLPPPKDAEVFDRDRVPWLLGATSKRPGRDFSVVALSLSIVQEIVNIPVMLQRSGISLSHRERMVDPACPLVILGGASALYTSALFSDDPMVDGVFIGEDASTIAGLFRVYRDACSSGTSRSDALEQMCQVPGFFVPGARPETRVFHAPAIDAAQLVTCGPVLTDETTIGRGHVQISEGCACFCGFCAESFSRKPYREVDATMVRGAALEAKKNMGIDDLDLYSFNFNMHRDQYRILSDLALLFPSIGLKSQRFDAIAYDAGLLDWLHALEKTSLTCGLEGISPRLRRYLHKSIEEADLAKALRTIVRAKIRELKIFCIATGLETDEDVIEFKGFISSLRSMMQVAGRSPRVIFSMTPLVRFPGTPLEFEDAPAPSKISAIMGRCGQIVRAAGFEFRTSASAGEYWLSQVMARAADGRVGRALRDAQQRTGFVYYRDIDEQFILEFARELEYSGFSAESLLAGSLPKARKEKPWHGLDTGITGDFLARQWEAARRFDDDGYCAGTAKGAGTCRYCGACATGDIMERIAAQPKNAPFSAQEFRRRLATFRDGERLFHFRVTVLKKAAGLPRAVVGVALGRGLMRADERLVEGYRGFRGSASIKTWGLDWIIGDDYITLAWDASCEPVIGEALTDRQLLTKVNDAMNGYGTVVGMVSEQTSASSAIVFHSTFRFNPDGYGKTNGLKHTLRKTGEGAYRYDFSKEALKKKVIAELSLVILPDEWTVTVAPGPKFAAEKFAQSVFALPDPVEWVNVGMEAVFRS
jgi:radical SAM superfamily enzyme YgiQ (UPF0313 family)